MLQMLNYTSLCLPCLHLLQCISLCFVCCKGIKNIKKQKNGESMSDTRILQKPRKTKKNKMAEPMSQWIPEYCKNLEKRKKQKKTKWQNLCPSVWHGVSTFVFFCFLVFPGKTKKTKKNKMAEPMSQCLAWGQYFCFFLFFWFSQVKPKKQKKTKWQNLCPSVWHGVSIFVFLVFLVFPGKTKKNKKNKMAEPMSQCLAWGQYFCFFWFFGFPR